MPDNLLFWKGVSAFRAGHHRNVICHGFVVFRLVDIPAERDVGEFRGVEPQQVKIELQVFQVQHFEPQQLVVPSGVQRELIVRNQVCFFLRFGQVAEFDAGNRLEAEQSGGGEPPVAGDQAIFAVQQYRIRKPEFLDAGRDLRHLIIRVRPGVSGIWNKAFERPQNDFEVLRNGSYWLRGNPPAALFFPAFGTFPIPSVFPLCCDFLDDFFNTGIVQRIPSRQRGAIRFFRPPLAIFTCAENPGRPA
jgi:hypothetical protein